MQAQTHTRLCAQRDLSEHDVVLRIMRKDNYLIGLLNKGCLALHVPLPGMPKRCAPADVAVCKRQCLSPQIAQQMPAAGQSSQARSDASQSQATALRLSEVAVHLLAVPSKEAQAGLYL